MFKYTLLSVFLFFTLTLCSYFPNHFVKQHITPFEVNNDLSEFVNSAMNKSVDPCENFYQYACGNWIADNPIPSDKSSISRAFSIMGDHNNKVLLDICVDPASGKVNQVYSSCMNIESINKIGLTGINKILDVINFTSMDSFMTNVGNLHALGVGIPLFEWGVGIDAKDPSINVAQLYQGGLNLPSMSMYTDEDISDEYQTHIGNMFRLIGYSSSEADSAATKVVNFESKLAGVQLPPDQLLDPFTTYNKINITGLNSIAPSLNWNAYLEGIGFPDIVQINVEVPQFCTSMSQLVSSQDLDTLKYYLEYSVLHSYGFYLNKTFTNELFNFYGKTLYGLQEEPPRSEFCISTTDETVGDLLGAYFAKFAFGEKSKDVAEDMIHNIEASMTLDLTTITWMDQTTRNFALDKIAKVINLIGYPSNPSNYSNIEFNSTDLLHNVAISRSSSFLKDQTTIGGPSDRYEWEMTADTINAYYDPSKNEMVFPAGILQTPYFNTTFPASMRYGGIGVVMGHELTHGFDNQGRDYDGNGRLINWWTKQSAENFQQKVDCVINQYSSFEVLPGVYVNGNLTQGENVADLGGTKNAYRSYMNIIGSKAFEPSEVEGLSNIQLYFVAYAQGWCSNQTDESLLLQVLTDPHSPAEFRVIGPLQDLPEFSEVWNCKAGSYMNPTNRCEVW